MAAPHPSEWLAPDDGADELLSAAGSGDVDALVKLLDEGVDINSTMGNGYTVLHRAVMANSLECVQALVERGVDVDKKSYCTPLQMAAGSGLSEIVRVLVDAGADVAWKDYRGKTALDEAKPSRSDSQEVRDGKAECVAILEAAAEGLNTSEDEEDDQEEEDEEGGEDEDAWQDIWFEEDPIADKIRDAASNGRTDDLRMTFETEGRNVDDPLKGSEDKYNALHYAVCAGKIESVRLLIEMGANVNKKEGLSNTPLHMAAMGSLDNSYQHMVVPECVTLLLDKGAKIDARDYAKATPLHLAATHASIGAMRVLLDRGANVNATDGVKATPLHLAAENAKDVDDAIECMKLLLDKGAQINSQDRHKQTALHRARQVKVVRFLLGHGVDATVTNIENQTALEWFIEQGWTDCADAVREHTNNASSS